MVMGVDIFLSVLLALLPLIILIWALCKLGEIATHSKQIRITNEKTAMLLAQAVSLLGKMTGSMKETTSPPVKTPPTPIDPSTLKNYK